MTKKRILMCNYEFPPLGGGGSTASRYLARELCSLGHEVEMVTAAYSNLKRVQKIGRFTLRRLPALRKQEGQSNPLEMMSYVATATPYLLLRGAPRPDVVISFHSIPSGMPAWPLSMVKGIPHIILFEGGDIPGWLPGELELYHKLTLWLNRLIVYQAKACIANSEGLRRLALKSFKRDIDVIYHGVDTKRFSPPEGKWDRKPGKVKLLFVGRITTQKGLDLVLEALNDSRLRDLNWELSIAGTGPKREEYEKLSKDSGLNEKINFLGWCTENEVSKRMKEAHVYLLPSRYEGMPLALLEAISSGLALIGTRIAGIENIIEHEKNGYLIDSEDVEGLTDSLHTLLQNPSLIATMGKASRELALEKWSWKEKATHLNSIIDRVLTEPQRKQ